MACIQERLSNQERLMMAHVRYAGKTNLDMKSICFNYFLTAKQQISPEAIHVFRESREQELRIAIISIFHLLSDNEIYLFVNPALALIR